MTAPGEVAEKIEHNRTVEHRRTVHEWAAALEPPLCPHCGLPNP